MTNLMQRGIGWLSKRLHTAAAEPVTYRRGEAASDLWAVPTAGNQGVLDEASGAVVEWDGTDWLITAADLVLDGTLAEPQKGDQIVRGRDVYDVCPPPGGKAWQWIGPHFIEMRVHTKRVEHP